MFALTFSVCVHQADPVLVDIEEVCRVVDEERQQKPAEAPTQVREQWLPTGLFYIVCVIVFNLVCFLCFFQTSSLLLINDSSAAPAEVNKRIKKLSFIPKCFKCCTVFVFFRYFFSKWWRSHVETSLLSVLNVPLISGTGSF